MSLLIMYEISSNKECFSDFICLLSYHKINCRKNNNFGEWSTVFVLSTYYNKNKNKFKFKFNMFLFDSEHVGILK